MISRMILCVLLGLRILSFSCGAFTVMPQTSVTRLTGPPSTKLFWFGGGGDREKKRGKKDWIGKKKKKKKKKKGDDLPTVTEGMETIASTMESFKGAQEVGKRTAAITSDLSIMKIEGSAAKGRVKCYMDGQQRPTAVDVDETYLASVTADALNEALTKALQDAHRKSVEQMEDKMQGLYAHLGLPP